MRISSGRFHYQPLLLLDDSSCLDAPPRFRFCLRVLRGFHSHLDEGNSGGCRHRRFCRLVSYHRFPEPHPHRVSGRPPTNRPFESSDSVGQRIEAAASDTNQFSRRTDGDECCNRSPRFKLSGATHLTRPTLLPRLLPSGFWQHSVNSAKPKTPVPILEAWTIFARLIFARPATIFLGQPRSSTGAWLPAVFVARGRPQINRSSNLALASTTPAKAASLSFIAVITIMLDFSSKISDLLSSLYLAMFPTPSV
jgi:hypothetical protein